MIKIYYDRNSQQILSEEEAVEIATTCVENENYYIEKLSKMPFSNIWEMLTDESRSEIYEECIENVLEDDFYMREFDDIELK